MTPNEIVKELKCCLGNRATVGNKTVREAADCIEQLQKELEVANYKIDRIHKSLDYAEDCRDKARNLSELGVSNGLALGCIALTLSHEWRGVCDNKER